MCTTYEKFLMADFELRINTRLTYNLVHSYLRNFAIIFGDDSTFYTLIL